MFAFVIIIIIITTLSKGTSAIITSSLAWRCCSLEVRDIACVYNVPHTFTSSSGIGPLETAWISIFQIRKPRLREAPWFDKE